MTDAALGRTPRIRCDRALRFQLPGVTGAPQSEAADAGTPPGAPADPAHTFGWDTVFAVRISDVNAELAAPGVCPSRFAQAVDGVCDASGSFGPWRIATGPGCEAATLLKLRVPLSSGTLTFDGRRYELAGSIADVEIRLEFLPLEPGESDLFTDRLVIRRRPPKPRAHVATIANFKTPDGPDAGLVRPLMMAVLGEWFNAHLHEVSHTFAKVSLNRRLARTHLQWLSPTRTSYAFSNGADEEASFLGVLCMTKGRSAEGLVPQLVRSAIPAGARAGFLISSKLFLEEVARPSLLYQFPDATADDFPVRPEGPYLELNRDLATKTVTCNGIPYRPVVKELRVAVRNNELEVSYFAQVLAAPGVTVSIRRTSYHAVTTATLPNGRRTLQFRESRPPEQHHWTQTDPAAEVIEDLLVAIGLLVNAILAVLTEGAWLLVGTVGVWLLVGLAAATPEIIKAIADGVVGGETPDVEAFLDTAISTIAWTGSKGFSLTHAGFSDSLQLGGNPGFGAAQAVSQEPLDLRQGITTKG